jgi:hypothetical protein
MMTRRRKLIPITAVLAFGLAALGWAQVSVRPGQYDVVVAMTLPGESEPLIEKDSDCLSAAEAADVAKAMMTAVAEDGTCKQTRVDASGNKISFDFECELAGDVLRSTAEILIGQDAFTMTSTTQMEGGAMRIKADAKWVGESCPVSALP